MPTIEVSKGTYKRLKDNFDAFDGTMESCIITFLDSLDSMNEQKGNKRNEPETKSRITNREPKTKNVGKSGGKLKKNKSNLILKCSDLDNVLHTNVLSAIIDGNPIFEPSWSTVVHELLKLVKKRKRSKNVELLGLRVFMGRKNVRSFRYFSEHGFSIPPLNANEAYKIISKLCDYLNVRTQLTIQWSNSHAINPGRIVKVQF